MTAMAIQVLQSLVVVVFAPLYAGVITRAEAVVGSKRGPSVLQPYRDLAKLRPAQSMASRTVNSQGSRRTSGPASVRTRRVCAGQNPIDSSRASSVTGSP